MRLKGKSGIVTGAASGIGLASARLFAAQGAQVVLSDTQEAPGGRAAKEITQAGGEAVFVRSDVTSGSDVENLVSTAVESFGKLDFIFNNAGTSLIKSIVDSSEEDFDHLVGTNLKSVFLGCKYALPRLLENPKGGVILNMSSNGGLIGRPGDPLYNATKHGVVGLTKSLALAYAAQRVRVNALCPGPIDTPLVWQILPEDDRETNIRRAAAACPTPRMAAPEEVAQAALFLVSDESSFVNGAALPVDGAKAAGVFTGDRYRLDFDLLD